MPMTNVTKALVAGGGFLTASVITYVVANAVYEGKSGIEVFNLHKNNGYYLLDVTVGIAGAGVNYAITSCCDLYREMNAVFNTLWAQRLILPI